ncbi:hypothetical protein [Saccharothrix coeruleofusca]|uniref:hypothetical protein n=1 Tax=Saccharothrix coeruleofusca TaxID=33919 RepID=UPI003570AF37
MLCRRHDDPDGEANTLDSPGYIEHHDGDHRRAVGHYRQALARYRALGHTAMVAGALDHVGLPLAALGLRDEARAVWREALALYRDLECDEDAERLLRRLEELDGAERAVTG